MANEVKKMRKDAYNCEECVIVPPADIYETAEEYVIKADMPGTRREDLEITLEKNRLDIYGRVDEALTTYLSQSAPKELPFEFGGEARTPTVGDRIAEGV